MQKSRSSSSAARRRVPTEGLFCNYSNRICMQNRLEGFEYCTQHILEDKASPYKQCNYVSTRTAKRCTNAAPKADKKEGYCVEHCKLAMSYRYKMSQKQRPKENAETIIRELSHYRPTTNCDNVKKDDKEDAGVASKALEYGSSDESEEESLILDEAWRGDVESDAESVDSEQEDLLKHAGVYTAEEVALTLRDKLIRLQSLYIEQFKRLQHVMKERRRRYLVNLHHERDHCTVPLVSYKNNPKTRADYFKLLSLRKYHRRYGKEARLHRQAKERRVAVSEGLNHRPPMFARCNEVTAGVKCTNRVLPLSKNCLKHILSDHNQVLYRSCSFAACSRPVPEIVDGDPVCVYHAFLSPPSLLPEPQTMDAPEDVHEQPDDPIASLLDPMDLDHMTWSVSDSSLSSTISRLTSCLGPLATAPPTFSDMETSLDTSADEQPLPAG